MRLEADNQNLLKAYSSVYGLTMSEVLEFVWNQFISNQHLLCNRAQGLVQVTGFKVMPNAGKTCFGSLCLVCTKQIQCQAGIYEGVVDIKEDCKAFVSEEGTSMIGTLQENNDQKKQF